MSKPGCYGAASVFSHDSATCRACPLFVECSRESLERLQTLSERINVADLIKKHARAQARATPERAERHHETETRDTRVIQRAQPIEPIQRKTKLETVVFEIDPDTQSAIALIGNKKASAQAVTLCKTGTVESIVRDLNAGVNPIPPLPKWLHIVGNMLCPSPWPLTKQSMKAAFMGQLGWKDQTAASHVSIAVALITGLGIAVEEGQEFVLSKPKSAQ